MINLSIIVIFISVEQNVQVATSFRRLCFSSEVIDVQMPKYDSQEHFETKKTQRLRNQSNKVNIYFQRHQHLNSEAHGSF